MVATAFGYEVVDGDVYLIENEFSGEILGQYTSNPPQLGPRILTNDKEITIFTKVEDGKTYYSFASPYGMQSDDRADYLYFASPQSVGEPLALKNDESIWWEPIAYVSSDGRHYDYIYLKNKLSGLYMKDSADSNNSLSLRQPTRTGENPAIVTAAPLDNPDDRRFLWQITPTMKTPPSLNIALPQSGWSPYANKIAVLSSATAIATPHFRLKSADGNLLFEGDATPYGQYWDGLYFYTMNLNTPQLAQSGKYTLEVAGVTKELFVKEGIYLHPLRNHGDDAFNIEEIFDANFGFVTQWGRLENWWPQPYAFLASQTYWDTWEQKVPNTFPEWMWRDDTDANGNGKSIEPYDGTAIAKADEQSIYHGAWEMTDQFAHNYAYDGLVLYRLTQMYTLATTATLKAKLYDEILYGVEGMLMRQESDGSWRQGYMDKLKWTGTTAGLGAALAAAAPVVAQHDTALAAKVEDAVDRAWEYVQKRVDDASTWAVGEKGITPDGSILKATPPTQRNLWRESYLLFAVTRYNTTKESLYKEAVEKEVMQGTIAYNGWFGLNGTDLPGHYSAHGDWALTALLAYYPDASDEAKAHIESIAAYYYNEYIVKDDLLGGPFGTYGKYLSGYAAAYTWGVWKKILAALQLYHTFGERYARGVMVAQQAMNWYWGANPYSSSLLFGVGDFYVNGGWASYHTIGRHTSLESNGMHLLGYDGTYFSSETTVLGSLTLWYATMLFDGLDYSYEGVACYVENEYKGAMLQLYAGGYTKEQMAAYGVEMAKIASMHLPQGYEVRFYTSSDFSGEATQIQSDTASVTLAEDVASMEILYSGAVQMVPFKPTEAQSEPNTTDEGDTNVTADDGNETAEVNQTAQEPESTPEANQTTQEPESTPEANQTAQEPESTPEVNQTTEGPEPKHSSGGAGGWLILLVALMMLSLREERSLR